MKKCVKISILLLIIAVVIGITPNIVMATDETSTETDEVYVAWTVKNSNGEEVEGIRGGGDYGLQDLVIPGYNDYTNCYFELVVNAYVGEEINIDNFGTFTYTGETRNQYDMEWYIYEYAITEPENYNKPSEENNSYNFTINVEETGKSYEKWLGYKVVGERKIYKVESDNMSIAVEAGAETELSLKADVIESTNDTYLEMIQYINTKCDNECLGSFDISLVGGEYKGNLTITFTVGEKYNGKDVFVCHKKSDGTYEDFREVVTNGTITVTVSELSPFMISLINEQTTPTDNNTTVEDNNSSTTTNDEKELDETPKTGTIDLTYYIIPVVIISAAGMILTIKRKQAKH